MHGYWIELGQRRWGLSSDHLQPYYVAADTMIYDHTLSLLTYLNKVQITQGTTSLSGDKVIVFVSAKTHQMLKLVATGNPAKYSTLPDNSKKQFYAEARTIFYDAIAKKVLLKEEARVQQEQNIFTGPIIWYDISNGVVRSSSPNNQNSTVINIQPQSPHKSS